MVSNLYYTEHYLKLGWVRTGRRQGVCLAGGGGGGQNPGGALYILRYTGTFRPKCVCFHGRNPYTWVRISAKKKNPYRWVLFWGLGVCPRLLLARKKKVRIRPYKMGMVIYRSPLGTVTRVAVYDKKQSLEWVGVSRCRPQAPVKSALSTAPALKNALSGAGARGGVLRFGSDGGVPLKPPNPYPSLRVILAEKGIPIIRGLAEKDTHY